jgi:hypothetical protein
LGEGKLRELHKEQEENAKKFPLVSHTFVDDEIAAVESAGEGRS